MKNKKIIKKKPRNKFEARIHKELTKLKVPFKYESEKLAYILAKHYIPDFIIDTPLGKIYIELKGHLRREDKAKMVAVKKQYPSKDIRILFYAPVKAYIRWAERNGFLYAVGKIPPDWLDGSFTRQP
jgi:hypothetical protein